MLTPPVADTPHLVIVVDPALELVRAVRAALLVTSDDTISEMRAYAREALRALPRARYGLLFDLRAAPLAVETIYAEQMRALRRDLVTGFRRCAFLVETKVGALQARRFVREEGLAVTVFDDEPSALAFLAAR